MVLIGSDFQIRVWQALLKIPFGRAVTYSDIACDIGQPTASRAVGAAVGRNPISFVVPCHRALGKSGALTGYHWGLTRKRAILGWETAQAGIEYSAVGAKTLTLPSPEGDETVPQASAPQTNVCSRTGSSPLGEKMPAGR